MSAPTCAHEGCTRPIYQNPAYSVMDKCIFHCEGKDPQEFRDALARQIREWRNTKAPMWDFSRWVIVDIERNRRNSGRRSNLFCRAIFPGDAYFDGATILGQANFRKATFIRNAFFRSTLFAGDAVFDDAIFGGRVSFLSTRFMGYTTFSSATLKNFANFFGTTFSEYANFSNTTFSGPAFFKKAEFSESLSFDTSNFLGETNFGSAKLSGNATFNNIIFSRLAVFDSATFSGDAYFKNATFSEAADFSGATFRAMVDMTYVSFAIMGNLSGIRIGGEAKLTWPGVGYKRNEKGEKVERGRMLLKEIQFEKLDNGQHALLDMSHNHLQDDCKLIFENTNMDNVLLEGTDCRLIQFKGNIGWPRWRPWPRWRAAIGWKRSLNWLEHGCQVVGDEYILREFPEQYPISDSNKNPLQWRLIHLTYQQLTDRFRKDLNHPLANDFERGIFEARYMAAKQEWKKDWRSIILLKAYKLASNFGGSLFRPIAWLFGIMIACSLCYAGYLFDGRPVWPWQTDWNLFFESWTASMRVMSLDRGWLTRQMLDNHIIGGTGTFLSFVALLQTVLTATLVTLFIFAVRRRFKHSE